MRHLSESVYHLLVTLFLAFIAQVLANQAYTYIAGYEPQSDVVQHSRIDLDVNKTIDSLPDRNGGYIKDCTDNKCNFNGATLSAEAGDSYSVWTNGEFSAKSSGPVSYTHLTLPTKRIV